MALSSDRQGIRLFFSADLVGSTALKTKEHEMVKGSSESPATYWPIIFQKFFVEITDGFFKAVSTSREYYQNESYPSEIHVWRMIGDEMLFYSSPVSTNEDVQLLCYAFVSTVETYDKAWKKKGLGVKGSIWSAGFPIRNKLIRIDPKISPYFWVDDLTDDPTIDKEKRKALWHSEQVQTDFLGPEIDLGFRLTSCTRPGRTVISLDASVLIAQAPLNVHCKIRVSHVGWKILKGVYNEIPHPIIWIDTLGFNEKPFPRTSYEESDSSFSKNYLSGNCFIENEELLNLNTRYFEDTKQYRLKVQYLKSTDPMVPSNHIEKYKQQNKE